MDVQLTDIHDHLPELWTKAVESQRRSNAKPDIGVPRIYVGDLVRDFPDNVVQKFVSHRRNPTSNHVELKVGCLGFDAAGDTWESISELT